MHPALPGQALQDIRHIARSPRLWPHAVREGARPPVGELLWGGALELSGRANGRSYEREILDALHRLRARDTSVLALFSEGDRGLAYLERHLGPGYRSVLEDNAVAFDIIRGPDHTFRPLWSHDLLRRALEGQLQRIGFLEFETERSLEPERWPFLEPRLTCRVGTMGRTEEVIDGACFRVNSPHVIHETIDGEVIVISLATGSYYSMKGSAADAWELIQRPAGVGAADLLEALAARFDTPASELEAAFGPFLAELRAEGLVSWTGIEEPVAPVADHRQSNGRAGAEPAFELPLLEKFTDMQDIVLLDPVHEVDDTGWPQPRTDGEARAGSDSS